MKFTLKVPVCEEYYNFVGGIFCIPWDFAVVRSTSYLVDALSALKKLAGSCQERNSLILTNYN